MADNERTFRVHHLLGYAYQKAGVSRVMGYDLVQQETIYASYYWLTHTDPNSVIRLTSQRDDICVVYPVNIDGERYNPNLRVERGSDFLPHCHPEDTEPFLKDMEDLPELQKLLKFGEIKLTAGHFQRFKYLFDL